MDTFGFLFFGQWALIASAAYFCQAINIILDKILLGERRIASPISYAFYGGVWSILALMLAPLGMKVLSFADFFMPSPRLILLAFASGAASIFALWTFYAAVKAGEPTRVATALGGLSPGFVLLLSFLFFGVSPDAKQLAAVAFFICGGLLVSYRRRDMEKTFLPHESFLLIVLAAFLFAVTFTVEKVIFNDAPFVQGFVWTRIGAFVTATSLLLFPVLRAGIRRWSPRTDARTSGLFIVNKLIGASVFFLLSVAISIAHSSEISIINAMQGFQYMLVFVLALAYSFWRPALLSERLDAGAVMRKILAIALISLGFYLLS